MVFVDIDNDPTTFSSSSATFTTSPCNRVVYAGLYWGARFASTTPAPNEVKFKIPGGTYQDLTADANLDMIYYKDVTNIVTTNIHGKALQVCIYVQKCHLVYRYRQVEHIYIYIYIQKG